MCFSAQGYALLNEKLAPHIAVLEGGYSIERALPYVNVGIILAMAGLDYSHVQNRIMILIKSANLRNIKRFIENEAQEIINMWKNRKNMKAKIVGPAVTCGAKKIYIMIQTISRKTNRNSACL